MFLNELKILKLTKIKITSSITSIGSKVFFYKCQLLDILIIPSSVTTIGDNSIYNTDIDTL